MQEKSSFLLLPLQTLAWNPSSNALTTLKSTPSWRSRRRSRWWCRVSFAGFLFPWSSLCPFPCFWIACSVTWCWKRGNRWWCWVSCNIPVSLHLFLIPCSVASVSGGWYWRRMKPMVVQRLGFLCMLPVFLLLPLRVFFLFLCASSAKDKDDGDEGVRCCRLNRSSLLCYFSF